MTDKDRSASVDVAICIPSRGRMHRLKLCATRTVRRLNPVRPVHIIGSDTYAPVNIWDGCKFHLVQTEGWTVGAAYSACVDYALTYEPWWEYLLIVEDDAQPEKDMLWHMVDAMQKNPQIGFCSPYGRYLKLSRRSKRKEDCLGSINGTPVFGRPMNYFGAMLIRRSLIDRIGNFDPLVRYQIHLDFMIRTYAAGFKYALIPWANIKHEYMKEGGIASDIKILPENLTQRGRHLSRSFITKSYKGAWRKFYSHKIKTGVVTVHWDMLEKAALGNTGRSIVDTRRRKLGPKPYTIEELRKELQL